MPRNRPPHIEKFRNRHGKTVWYFRVGKGPRLKRLTEPYGSEAFWKDYHEALAAHQAKTPPTPEAKTLGWLIDQFEQSVEYKTAARETKRQWIYQFRRMRELGAATPLRVITAAVVMKGRDKRAERYSDANKYVKSCRDLFKWAKQRGHMKDNPAKDVPLLKKPTQYGEEDEGFKVWTEAEAAAYEARWPVGTRERLAFDLLVYTGLRRSDVVRLGRQHIRNGVLSIKTMKSINSRKPVEVTLRVLPPLARSIAATETGDLTFIKNLKRGAKGGMRKESFGTWFKKACKEAGVNESGKAAHGLRKIAATRCAENGATEAELNAMFGWVEGSREAAVYTKKANRKRLAANAVDKLIPTVLDEESGKVIPLKPGA